MWNRSGYCFKPQEHPLCTARRLYRICAGLVRLAYVLTGGIFRLSDTPQFKSAINSIYFRNATRRILQSTTHRHTFSVHQINETKTELWQGI